MGSNHAQTRQNTEEIENKLDSILKAVESQHGFSKKNFVIMKKLVFLWVIGENAQIEELLKQKSKVLWKTARRYGSFTVNQKRLQRTYMTGSMMESILHLIIISMWIWIIL